MIQRVTQATQGILMSLIDTKIKPFKATAYHHGEFVDFTEKDVFGKWAIFFFYPADFTVVCPTELGDVADHYDELKKRGVEVYSVSTDTHFTHKAWHDSSETIGKIKRSEEHTSELQSRGHLVCRLLLEKK